MSNEPTVQERRAQPYVGIRERVTMRTLGKIGDRIPELFGFLGGQRIEPAGALFLRYGVVDMDGEFEVEAGVPTAEAVAGEGDIYAAELPAGRYVARTHHGHPDGLFEVWHAALAWAAERGLDSDVTATDAGERWGCRLETFRTNPAVEPDLNKWETEVSFRLAH